MISYSYKELCVVHVMLHTNGYCLCKNINVTNERKSEAGYVFLIRSHSQRLIKCVVTVFILHKVYFIDCNYFKPVD